MRSQRGGSAVANFAHFFFFFYAILMSTERGASAVENLGSPFTDIGSYYIIARYFSSIQFSSKSFPNLDVRIPKNCSKISGKPKNRRKNRKPLTPTHQIQSEIAELTRALGPNFVMIKHLWHICTYLNGN